MTEVVNAIGPSDWLDDRKSGVQRSVNLYPTQAGGAVVLASTPGLASLHDFGGNIRGLYPAGERLFIVAGPTLYEWHDGAPVVRGSLSSVSGDVGMAEGQGQLAVVDGGTLYVLRLEDDEWQTVASAGWLGSDAVHALDGYFIFVEPDTERFYISAIDDASTLDALDFSSADSTPDSIVTHAVARRELFLMGSRSIEVWVNTGAAAFPFSRLSGGAIDVGICGPNAYALVSGGLVWVGQSRTGGPYVYTLSGYSPQRISTQAVEQRLAAADLDHARCWSYQADGAEFVAVQAPGMSTTWVYDLATQLWHERGELSGGLWAQSRIERHAYVGGTHYVAGGSRLYRMSTDLHDIAGSPLVRERTWSHLIAPAYAPMPYRSLELRCTTGEGGRITLEVSNDGGAVYGSPLLRDLGAPGRRAHRVRWGPLGTCPAGSSRVHRLRVSDAVPLVIHSADLS